MLAFLGYLSADLGARLLPAPLADGAARRIARAVHALAPPARGILEANLERLFPNVSAKRRREWSRRAFENFALSLADFLRLARLDRAALERGVEVRGRDHLERARGTPRGVLVLSAHVGCWERGAAFLAAHGRRVHVVARPHPSRAVEGWFTRRRGDRGVAALRDRALWVGAARALRAGHWVALMGDRRPPAGRGSPCAWAAALARRTGALLLPAVMVRLPGGRHVACFEAPLTPGACVAGGYREILQRYVKRYPDQWLGFEPLPEVLG